MKHKYVLVFFLLWPITVFGITKIIPINAFFSSIFFFGVPSFVLSLLIPKQIKKSLTISLFILPFMTIVDYIAETTKTWIWPLPYSVIPYKLFGFVSIEVLLWAFLHVYLVIMFYQYFLGKHFKKRFWDKRSSEALFGTIAIFIFFLLSVFLTPTLLRIPYWYFIFGFAGIAPVVLLEDFRYPLIFPKLLKTACYFFYLNFTYEITALKLGWWAFPSKEFIGHVTFFGTIFPFEEFFFWIILFTLAILSYYEYFFNKER